MSYAKLPVSVTSRTDPANELLAEEVGGHFRHVVDDGGDSEERGSAVQVLQMPEQEGEDETHSEAHEPRDEEHGAHSQVGACDAQQQSVKSCSIQMKEGK